MRTRSAISDEIVGGSGSAEIILAKLRGMIAGGRQETDTILGTIAVAANALTGANGAAIAMPRDGAVVCVGRSGEIAPELGDLLNVDSGISGECLRTGTIMRCDDASRDFHVDADVCRQMGVQSIAVVPLRGQHGRVGVLEAFSAQSYAFTEEHMDLLGRLAGLAEAAWARAPEKQEVEAPQLGAEEELQTQPLQADPPLLARPIQTEALAEQPRLSAAAAALTRVGAAIMTGLRAELRTARRWRYGTIAVLAAILVFLLAVLSWKVWYKASLPISSTRSTGSPQEDVPKNPDATAGAGLAGQSGTEQALSLSTSAPTANISAPTSASPTSAAQAAKSPAAVESIRRKILVRGTSDRRNTNTATDAPEIATPGGGPTELESLLSASPALPRLGMPISQGVSGGVLVHKVLPTYTLEARQLHVVGTVVLEATINEGGQIEDLKLVSGHPLLAQPAMDAVRKWRYTPYLLNGKPIKKETQINITFIPQ